MKSVHAQYRCLFLPNIFNHTFDESVDKED